MSPALEYLLQVGPALFGVAVVSTLLGLMVGAVVWFPQQAKRRRIEREVERLQRDVRHARRAGR